MAVQRVMRNFLKIFVNFFLLKAYLCQNGSEISSKGTGVRRDCVHGSRSWCVGVARGFLLARVEGAIVCFRGCTFLYL